MNNPNPFVPKGSLLEQQSQRRFQLKVAVGCVLSVSVLGLVVMLIQGCKREVPNENLAPEFPTNTPSFTDTNAPFVDTNPVVMPPPMPTNQPVVIAPPVAPIIPETPGSTYEVVKGDTLTTIAKAHHVTLKELQAANPGVDSKHLKLKQKITIPAAKAAAEVAPIAGAAPVVADASSELYTIKSGDTLDKIAKAHHTTAKAIQAANNLTTTKIVVGKKLKLPVKAEAAPAAPVAETTTSVVPMIPAPAPTPASAPVLTK
jgi:LysM repeat protein